MRRYNSISESPIVESGLYYPNKFGLVAIRALENVMGRNGLNSILNLAGQSKYIENTPLDNLENEFEFSSFSALTVALEDFRVFAGIGDMAFKTLPLKTKLRFVLLETAKYFCKISDQQMSFEEKDTEFVITTITVGGAVGARVQTAQSVLWR